MTPDQLTELIEHGDIAGIVAATRDMTEEERQPLAEVASRFFKKYQRLAHFGIDQNLREAHSDENQELWKWIGALCARHPDPHRAHMIRPAIHLAFCVAAPNDEVRETLTFFSKTLQQHFFYTREQVDVLIARQLPAVREFFKTKKAVEWLQGEFLIPLIRAGIIDKSLVAPNAYLEFLFAELEGSPALATQRRSELILSDFPDVIDELWQGFDTAAASYLFPPRSGQDEMQALLCYDSWGSTFRQLCNAGRMDRGQLLTATRTAISRDDFDANSQKNFIALHDDLQITQDERAADVAEYVGMLSSRAVHVVKFALDVIGSLEKDKRLDGAAFYEGARAVFQLKPEAHPKTTLSISEKLAKRKPECVPQAIDLALDGLIHDSHEIQEQAVKQLEGWSSRFASAQATLLSDRLPMVAASVRERVQKLIAKVGESSHEDTDGSAATPSPKKSAATKSSGVAAVTAPVDDSGRATTAAVASSVPSAAWLDDLVARAASIAEPWRRLAGIDDAIAAAREGRLPAVAPFRLIDVPTLSACEPIAPIESVDELLDAVAHAIERVDSADDIERIIDGIARLADQRPDDLAQRAAPLLLRLPTSFKDDAWKGRTSSVGLSGENAFPGLQRFVISWLKGRESRTANMVMFQRINLWQGQRLNEVLPRMVAGQPTRLLSTPTHRGGWIDARVFVERLLGWQTRREAVLPRDLLLALLRLTPDGRAAAREAAAGIETTIGRVVRWALGSDQGPTSSDESDLALWLAAGRCRSPEGEIPELRQFAQLNDLPFAASNTRLVWKEAAATVPASALRGLRLPSGFIQAVLKELKEAAGEEVKELAALFPNEDGNTPDAASKNGGPDSTLREEQLHEKVDAPLVAYWIPRQSDTRDDNFLTTCLADHVAPESALQAPAYWERQWLASRWPLNTDPYFSAALTAIRRRLNSSKASVLEPNHVLLDPLFHPDRPWTEMACVLLALSLLSREADTRGVAVDALIASISDGRVDSSLLAATWFKMSACDFLKLNRISEVLNGAAIVSPLHRWFAADVTQRLTAAFPDWPSDGHYLLASLVEWLTDLSLPITTELRAKLTNTKFTGKATKLSQTLLKLPASAVASVGQTSALQMALESRLSRAERWSAGIL